MDLLGREFEMIMNDRAEDEIHFHNLRNQFLKSTNSRKEERVAIISCILRNTALKRRNSWQFYKLSRPTIS